MDEPPRLPTARELVDAFVHPARVIQTPYRGSGDQVLVVSHIEIWPWRVVVRGLRADATFVPRRREVQTVRHGIRPVDVAPDEGGLLQLDADWPGQWSLHDDVGTAYRYTGGTGDFRGVLWTDFSIAFEPAVPDAAGELTLRYIEQLEIVVPVR
jgi:hypothetical protein